MRPVAANIHRPINDYSIDIIIKLKRLQGIHDNRH
jgi:hypothetical protein